MPPHTPTGLTITNPLVKYRSLLATKAIRPDNGQLRLALHLQKLYDRLKDYEPQIEYSARLDQLSRSLRSAASSPQGLASSWRTIFTASEPRDTLALTRRLTSHESAIHISSPQGLMLHGEVGTGKSMLIDLFADCLPSRKKRRWHFNTFMLETFAKLESLRVSRSDQRGGDDEYSLLWLAKDLAERSPIVFLDEFQMPDRVASKILTNLMTAFFHLGGVLVATSNRMPEELAKASGMEFSAPTAATSRWGFWRMRGDAAARNSYAGQGEFRAFLEVLRARCEVWEMEGRKDWRRAESQVNDTRAVTENEEDWRVDGHEDLQHAPGMAGWPLANQLQDDSKDLGAETEHAITPQFYTTGRSDDPQSQNALSAAFQTATGSTSPSLISWTPSTLHVYGRTIPVPRTHNAITSWTFDELCKTTLGPADYITLASTYHTLLLTDVPVLSWLMKNEARRFITLLDALYECRCKLFITAAAGPDDLFFPDRHHREPNATNTNDGADAVYPETLSEVYQDATAPFRPNILTQNPNYAEPDPAPDYTHARLAGLLAADALEDDPPNRPALARSFGRSDAEMERAPVDPDESTHAEPVAARMRPDFGQTGKFTGEDERFAYKRAQSRLWEMCSARWWARSEEGWHRPLPSETRRWERSLSSDQASNSAGGQEAVSEVAMGASAPDETRDEHLFRHGASPFRTTSEPPPKFSWTHVWGTMKWGPKAGAWGQGVEGLKDRGKEKR